jgi:acetyltransferase-like isoleucine patch superfamily enzyme
MMAPGSQPGIYWTGRRDGEHAVAGFGFVIAGSIPPYEIHRGNPAVFVRRREIGAAQCNRSMAALG